MASLAEAIQAVAQGLQQRQQYNENILTARRAQRQPQRALMPQEGPTPTPGDDGGFGGLPPGGPTTQGGPQQEPPPAPPGKQWYLSPSNEWILGDAEQTISLQNPQYSPELAGINSGLLRIPSRLTEPTLDVGLQDPLARQAALGGQLGLLDSWSVLAGSGLPDSLIKDLLLGESAGGGGSPYAGLYADLAVRQQEEQERQNRIQNIAEIVGAQMSIAQENQRRQAEQAGLLAQLAPFMPAGRTYAGGFEGPGSPAAALSNFAGTTFTPRPLQTVNIPTGYSPVQEPPEMALLRQIVGV